MAILPWLLLLGVGGSWIGVHYGIYNVAKRASIFQTVLPVPKPLLQSKAVWHDYFCGSCDRKLCKEVPLKSPGQKALDEMVPPEIQLKLRKMLPGLLKYNYTFKILKEFKIANFACCSLRDDDAWGLVLAESDDYLITFEIIDSEMKANYFVPRIGGINKRHCKAPMRHPMGSITKASARGTAAWPDHAHFWLIDFEGVHASIAGHHVPVWTPFEETGQLNAINSVNAVILKLVNVLPVFRFTQADIKLLRAIDGFDPLPHLQHDTNDVEAAIAELRLAVTDLRVNGMSSGNDCPANQLTSMEVAKLKQTVNYIVTSGEVSVDSFFNMIASGASHSSGPELTTDSVLKFMESNSANIIESRVAIDFLADVFDAIKSSVSSDTKFRTVANDQVQQLLVLLRDATTVEANYILEQVVTCTLAGEQTILSPLLAHLDTKFSKSVGLETPSYKDVVEKGREATVTLSTLHNRVSELEAQVVLVAHSTDKWLVPSEPGLEPHIANFVKNEARATFDKQLFIELDRVVKYQNGPFGDFRLHLFEWVRNQFIEHTAQQASRFETFSDVVNDIEHVDRKLDSLQLAVRDNHQRCYDNRVELSHTLHHWIELHGAELLSSIESRLHTLDHELSHKLVLATTKEALSAIVASIADARILNAWRQEIRPNLEKFVEERISRLPS